jgi:pSer/pThr/pTyr-binding forkhead associated (FHA) protein
MAAPGHPKPTSSRTARCVVARVTSARGGPGTEGRFTSTFTIGRAADCGLRVQDPAVEPHHAQLLFDGIVWWIRHVAASGETLVDGSPVRVVPLQGDARLELGKGGPVVSLALSERGKESEREGEEESPGPEAPASAPARGEAPELTEDEIIRRYMKPVGSGPAGKQTMMFRAAFAKVQKKSSRRYRVVIAAIAAVLLVAAGIILYQRQKLKRLNETGEQLFYAMKAFELRTDRLEEVVLASADPAQVAALEEGRAKLAQMETEYDKFVQELGVYGRVAERQRYILRVARRFGECEVNIPKSFVHEVERYIDKWRGTDRLQNALRRAKQHGYGVVITRAFAQGKLPPQYVYLALQESNFDERAVGPPTRYGVAKGMWQFISLTGHRYGLKIGPLYEQAVYDPADERFDWPKATKAAVKYIRTLTVTEAQASGLLVMASYNWGENNVRGIIASMPENPRDRNFWRLLAHDAVPRETYDYVLSIFSMAVICENPRYFGFDLDCPTPPQPRIDEMGRDLPR